MRSNFTLLVFVATLTVGCATVLGFEEGTFESDAGATGGTGTNGGGASHSGGSSNAGGTANNGGTGVAGSGLGGTVSAGGVASSGGGTPATGGSQAVDAAGGAGDNASTGGAIAVGGTTATGGTPATGDSQAVGGAVGTNTTGNSSGVGGSTDIGGATSPDHLSSGGSGSISQGGTAGVTQPSGGATTSGTGTGGADGGVGMLSKFEILINCPSNCTPLAPDPCTGSTGLYPAVKSSTSLVLRNTGTSAIAYIFAQGWSSFGHYTPGVPNATANGSIYGQLEPGTDLNIASYTGGIMGLLGSKYPFSLDAEGTNQSEGVIRRPGLTVGGESVTEMFVIQLQANSCPGSGLQLW